MVPFEHSVDYIKAMLQLHQPTLFRDLEDGQLNTCHLFIVMILQHTFKATLYFDGPF